MLIPNDATSEQQPPVVPLETLLSQKKISQLTYDKVLAAKKYIERKYNYIKIKKLENNIIQEKLNALNIPEKEKQDIINTIQSQEKKRLQKIREKMKEIAPIEKTLNTVNVIENLHKLIKNNGKNFNLTQEEIELVALLK